MSEQKQKRSNPLVRVALMVVLIGAVLVIGGLIAVLAFQQMHHTPIDVAAYPEAELVTELQIDSTHNRLRYVSASPVEEVGAFYIDEIENCTVIQDSAAEEGQPAVSYRCLVDGSSFFVTQYTRVTIQAGTGEYAGQTLIDVEQVFGE